MVQYKSVVIPVPCISGIKSNNLFTVETANKLGAPYAALLQREAVGGWILHSIQSAPGKIKRKKGFLEILLGWVPVIGFLFIPRNSGDVYSVEFSVAVFFKES